VSPHLPEILEKILSEIYITVWLVTAGWAVQKFERRKSFRNCGSRMKSQRVVAQGSPSKQATSHKPKLCAVSPQVQAHENAVLWENAAVFGTKVKTTRFSQAIGEFTEIQNVHLQHEEMSL
jgi:hypothetical protein